MLTATQKLALRDAFVWDFVFNHKLSKTSDVAPMAGDMFSMSWLEARRLRNEKLAEAGLAGLLD